MNKIKMLRSEKGMTLKGMAQKADVGIATLARLENGKKASSLTLARVARVLEIEITELLEFEADSTNKGRKPKPILTPVSEVIPEPEPVKLKFTGQVKENAWAVARELDLTISQVKNYMLKSPGMMGLPYEELKKAVAEKFKR
jgi:DNA-binding XRE family transcriptional regulator